MPASSEVSVSKESSAAAAGVLLLPATGLKTLACDTACFAFPVAVFVESENISIVRRMVLLKFNLVDRDYIVPEGSSRSAKNSSCVISFVHSFNRVTCSLKLAQNV